LALLAKLGGGISALVVFTYVLSMAFVVLLLTLTSIGQDMASNQARIILGVLLIIIPTPFEVNVLASFLVLFGIFGVSLLVAAKTKGGLTKNMRQLFSNSLQRKLPNWLLVMPLASSALLIVVLAVTIVQDLLGVPTGSIPLPCDTSNPLEGCIAPFKFLYLLAYAPPVEETMFRISTLGLLVALRTTWSRQSSFNGSRSVEGLTISRARLAILSFLFPEYAKRRAGLSSFEVKGWKSIHWTEWLILMVTSAGFGVAHYVTNVGWEAGKVLTAGLAGVVLGLAYLLYGAYASILMHWFFNVYLGTFSLSSLLMGGFFISVEEIVGLLVFVAGVVGLALGLRWFRSTLTHGGETTYTVQGGLPVVPGEGALYHRQVD